MSSLPDILLFSAIPIGVSVLIYVAIQKRSRIILGTDALLERKPQWQIPPEVASYSIPRQVFFRGWIKIMLIVSSVILAISVLVLLNINLKSSTNATVVISQIVFVGLFLLVGVREELNRVALLRWGEPTLGVVTGTLKVRGVLVFYNYLDEEGHVLAGRGPGVGLLGEMASFNVGELVTVIYDPKRPHRNLLFHHGMLAQRK